MRARKHLERANTHARAYPWRDDAVRRRRPWTETGDFPFQSAVHVAVSFTRCFTFLQQSAARSRRP